jgi:uncharacterized MnhB-related membrane protein
MSGLISTWPLWGRVITACLATAALWWFMFLDVPEVAVLEGLLSSAVATAVMARLIGSGL